jgi:hypothetical protein
MSDESHRGGDRDQASAGCRPSLAVCASEERTNSAVVAARRGATAHCIWLPAGATWQLCGSCCALGRTPQLATRCGRGDAAGFLMKSCFHSLCSWPSELKREHLHSSTSLLPAGAGMLHIPAHQTKSHDVDLQIAASCCALCAVRHARVATGQQVSALESAV